MRFPLTMRRTQRQSRDWVRLACFTAAAFAVLLLAVGAAFWHQDEPGSEATCAICHVAHLTPLPGSPVGALPAPLFVAWHQPAEAQLQQLSPSTLNAPPRAPPA